jgi:hypothetical protein
MSRRFEPASLVAGLAMTGLGLLLLLDDGGSLELSGGWLAAVICAAIGAILIASGLASRAS